MRKTPISLLLIIFWLVNPVGIVFAAPVANPAQQSSPEVTPALVDQIGSTTTATWEPMPLPSQVTTATVISVAVNPVDAYTIFLATTTGLYKSTNAGDSWRRVGAPNLDYMFQVTTVDSDSQRVYARSWDSYRSDDGGESWNKMAFPPHTCGIAVAPSQADHLYVRRCPDGDGPPVLRSVDGGQSWITPATPLRQPFGQLVVAPDQPDVLIATTFTQTWRSADAGESWTLAAIGDRFNSQPVFDPRPPYTLYLGHWQGLLRSGDAGLTWQDSSADREFTALAVDPTDQARLIGGNRMAAWALQVDAVGWRAAALSAPEPLLAIWRSAQDGRMIYAMTSQGFVRQKQATSPQFIPSAYVYLPIVKNGQADTTEVLRAASTDPAIEQANTYRQIIHAIPLLPHTALSNSTANHAAYHMTNHNDTGAWQYGPHGEVTDKPHFTGRWPSDRVKAAGYPYFGGAEVMHFIGDPVASVDGWMATIFHRLILLDPSAHYAGYGSDKNDETAVDVMDFGGGPTEAGIWSSALPYPLAYPADGQTDVPPAWGGGESPDPLPPGAQRPVGYPFTLQGIGGKLQINSAVLRSSDGQAIAVHPNPTDCANFNCYALIAVAPLQPNTAYVVEASGTVGTVTFQQSWHFTTGDSALVAAAQGLSMPAALPVQAPPTPTPMPQP